MYPAATAQYRHKTKMGKLSYAAYEIMKIYNRCRYFSNHKYKRLDKRQSRVRVSIGTEHTKMQKSVTNISSFPFFRNCAIS